MVNNDHSDERLGRPLDYSRLKHENREFCYSIGTPFINDRIDRANPLDRVLYKGQWFVSGYVVSRLSKDNHKIYSQIVRIYSSSYKPYHAALIDLKRRHGFLPSQKFHPRHYEAEMVTELLIPLSQLDFVDYTPTLNGYFNPVKVKIVVYLRNLVRLRCHPIK